MAWTKEQEAAIKNRGSNIIVSAGAGSGKTAVLSERILQYCLNGNDIRKVLVLTFTNAAAREMKERIRKKLLQNKLFQQADYIDASYITTFDAYSLALVKKYYYKLGLSKDISIMDASLIALKRKNIIEELFQEFYRNEDIRFFSYLKKYSKQDDKDIIKTVETLCSKMDLIVHLDEFIKNYEAVYFSEGKIHRIIEEFEINAKERVFEFVVELKELQNACSQDMQSKNLYDAITYTIHELESLNSYNSYYLFFNSYTLPRVSSKASEYVKELKTSCGKTLKNLLDSIFSKYKNTEQMKEELKAIQPDILFILDVCKEVFKRLFAYKKEVMLFDYTDIAKFAIDLVTNYEDVKNELKYYYNEILVDEYQDTSDIQEAFLNEIENNNLYMVGDIKQSIYRFRNANPYIFKFKYDNYSKGIGGQKIDLSYNFRSRSEVLDNINALFSQLMTEFCGDANYRLEHQMKFGLKIYNTLTQDFDYNLDILKYVDDDYKDYTQEEIEAFIAAKKIKDILNKKPKVLKGGVYKEVNYNDFAILVDKAKSFTTFKKVFEYFNIPLSIEADMDLKDSILPKLFANIVLLIYKTKKNEFDIPYKHALTALARSFLYEYTDEQIYRMIVLKEEFPIMEDIKELASDQENSIESLFYTICFKTKIYEKLNLIGDVDNSIVVLEYIYKMFVMFQQTSMELQEASMYLSTIFESDIKLSYKLQSNMQDSVKIMTIHKSKGLEFPYCIFPLLSSSFNKEEARASTGFHMNYGIYLPFADEGKSNTIIKTLIEDKIIKADISERVRLLYVALTRAREKIILIMKDKEFSDSKRFSSFQQMINYFNVYENKVEDISLKDYSLSMEYKKKRISLMDKKGKKQLNYPIIRFPNKISNVRISKELQKLPTKQQKESLKLGLEFHNALEVLDFKNPNVDALPVSHFIKTTIKVLLKHELFQNAMQAKSYHEHEFYFEEGLDKYHGIIDLFFVYEDHIDIIDYKLSNLDSMEYIRQLSIYKKYIASKWEKPIFVYLLSILKTEIKKLDI